MRLLIDIGNQRLKWLTSDHLDSRQSHSFSIPQEETGVGLDFEASLGSLSGLQSIWASCVSRERVKAQLTDYCWSKWGMSVNFIRSTRQAAGVINQYQDPGRLGVDRWAALIAARNRGADSHTLVIDAGTAVTMDYLDRSGRFCGGVIFPGIQTMRRALNTQTEKITIAPVLSNKNAELNVMNTDTQTSVDNGALLAVSAAVERGILRFRELSTSSLSIIITGGDAPQIMQMIDHEMHYEKNLVLQGINILAEESNLV